MFHHPATRTLLFTDLAFNVPAGGIRGAQVFIRLSGAAGRFGPHRFVRWFMVRDRVAARESRARILRWDFDRVIVTHGEVLERGGRIAIEAGFAFPGWRFPGHCRFDLEESPREGHDRARGMNGWRRCFGCTIPTLPVGIFGDTFGDEFDFSGDESTCRSQCNDLRNGCNGVAKGAKKCIGSGIDAFLEAEGRNCNDIADSGDLEPCRQQNKSSQRSFKSGLGNDTNDAKDDRRDAHELRIAFCSVQIR